jgi:hypothetical protein
MLDRAKFLIISEVSEVMRETAPAIEARVDRALERCFVVKAAARPAARPTATARPKTAKAAARVAPAAAPRRAVRAS